MMSALFSKGKDEKSRLGSQIGSQDFPNLRDNGSYNDLNQTLRDFKGGNGDTKSGSKGDNARMESEAQSKITSHSFNLVNSRLTLLEDRYNTVRERLNFAERTLIDNREGTNKKIKVLDSELSDMSSEISELREVILSLQEEIK